ncbi:MAG: hypothetical protein MJA83_02505, partial [Gammaproteobacteria bacterium]|nr:hypothetical protein [Gammaproteobacteria bacterium]
RGGGFGVHLDLLSSKLNGIPIIRTSTDNALSGGWQHDKTCLKIDLFCPGVVLAFLKCSFTGV